MAYWGKAWAYGPYVNNDKSTETGWPSYETIQKAMELRSRGKETKKALIEALAVRYSPGLQADTLLTRQAWCRRLHKRHGLRRTVARGQVRPPAYRRDQTAILRTWLSRDATAARAPPTCTAVLRVDPQHETHLLLFLAPRLIRSFSASGNGCVR